MIGMSRRALRAGLAAILTLGPALAQAGPPQHVEVEAAFVPAKTGSGAAVAVWLRPKDAAVRVNEEPAPRLVLDPAQAILVDRAPAAGARAENPAEPGAARYLDPGVPVRFPVVLAGGAPKGLGSVRATVSYFYCSKTAGWCRKGSSEVEFSVKVP
jgi:hypothetical protein